MEGDEATMEGSEMICAKALLDVSDAILDTALHILERELNLPNIPMKVNPDGAIWTTLVERDGWKLQQNMFTKHARLLNSDNIRVAWGTVNGAEKALGRIVELPQKYNKDI